MKPKLELECAIGAIKNRMGGRAKTYTFEKEELKAAQQINKKEKTHLSIHLALGDPFDQSTSMPAAPLDHAPIALGGAAFCCTETSPSAAFLAAMQLLYNVPKFPR